METFKCFYKQKLLKWIYFIEVYTLNLSKKLFSVYLKEKVCDVLFKKILFPPQTNISFKVILIHYISVIEWNSKTTFMICTCNVIFCLCFIHFTSPPRQVLAWLLTYLPLFYVIYAIINTLVPLSNHQITIN